MTDPLAGLDEAAVRDRVLRGEVNEVPRAASRTVWEIVRSNLFTPFNALLGTLFVVILMVGAPQDALFGIVLVANTAIGIFQELRAKRTLDRLAVLTAPRARVVRAGRIGEIAVGDVVVDDVLELRPGDQVVVDGEVLASTGLEIDESLLSGESEPLVKEPGAEVLSGSFVAAGSGQYRATRVGRAAYASSLAEQAKRFTLVRSELRAGINRILLYVTWAIVPTAALLFVSQFRIDNSWRDAVSGAVAGTVGMVPEGLVLLTSVAFGVAVVRLARKRVLVQELPAVEGLARVDVLCTDKTGTLTEGHLQVQDLEVLAIGAAEGELAEALGQLAAADPAPNATMIAVGAAYPCPPVRWDVAASVPFSSARKWSGTSFNERATWVLGAPSVLLDAGSQAGDAKPIARVKTHAEAGRRVVLPRALPNEARWRGPAGRPRAHGPGASPGSGPGRRARHPRLLRAAGSRGQGDLGRRSGHGRRGCRRGRTTGLDPADRCALAPRGPRAARRRGGGTRRVRTGRSSPETSDDRRAPGKGPRGGHDGRRGERRARPQGRRHRGGHGLWERREPGHRAARAP